MIRSPLHLVLSVAAAAALAIPSTPVSAASDHGRGAALQRLDAAADLLSTGSISDGVLAVAGLGAIQPEHIPARAATSPVPLTSDLRAPVELLLGAVHTAGELGRAALRVEPRVARAAMREVRAVVAGWNGKPDAPAVERLAALGRRYGELVDTRALLTGSLLLARAVEDALPALRAASRGLPARPGRVIGCEVADVPPVLCIGGGGANEYSGDRALVIDLGGNDIHTHSAGGADPLRNALAVSVTIDLGGNDVYRSSLAASGAAQGGGLTGGIGMLVDAAGNDSYSIEKSDGDEANGQGYGETGAGILADLAGNDTYRLRNVTPGVQSANGQGLGGLGGIGIALDVTGDDTYAVESTPSLLRQQNGVASLGSPSAYGFGYGIIGGLAAFADAGGTDSMLARAETASVDPTETAPLTTSATTILAFGDGAVGAVGIAVGGPGNTSWTTLSRNNSPGLATGPGGSSFAGGFGEGVIGGYGGMHDPGGDDTYLHQAINVAKRGRTADEACGCAGADARAFSDIASLLGQGYGVIGGVGVIQDLAGDDRYLAVASSIAEATAHDDRAEPPASDGPMARAEARAADPDAIVQGSSAAAGTGFIVDSGGRDAYDARVTSDATATATARSDAAAREAYALTAAADTFAQGFGSLGGYGEIRDLGGTDTYTAISRSSAVASPATVATPGPALTSVQGSAELGGIAHLADLDGGTGDTFVSAPADLACVGTRGQGAWVDCGLGVAGGVAA